MVREKAKDQVRSVKIITALIIGTGFKYGLLPGRAHFHRPRSPKEVPGSSRMWPEELPQTIWRGP